MDFRRIPFQFSSTDPAKRQAELQKRFGLPVNKDKDKMHVDFANSGLMGDAMSSASNSPRLQHRVPLFKEGSPEPMTSSVDSSPVAGRKPRVRVVPIEIEDDNSTKRNRNLSGSSVEDHLQKNGPSWVPDEFATSPILRSFIPDQKPKTPCERTIPIQVEGVGQSKKAKTVPVKKEKPKAPKKEASPKQNGSSPSKLDKGPVEPKRPLTDMIRIALSRKKIEGVLEKLKTYHAEVEKFTSTVKDKQYRYLDEMLTRLILELDDVETMGDEEVRLSRKAAVRKVQASVDLLEAKATGGASGQMPEVSAKEQDVEMEGASSQEENEMAAADSAMSVPAEDNCQVIEEPASVVVDKAEKTRDVEMENNAEDGRTLQEEALSTGKESKEYQVMDVDVDTRCSMEEPKCSEQSNVASDNITIKEVDSESSKESEQVSPSNEPVGSPVTELKSELELHITTDALDGEAKELKIDSDTTDCVNDLVSKSCHVDADNTSNLKNDTPISDEHSKDLITEDL